ncbi:hypothetical protein ACWENQ_11500 [Nonomuraea sp. NPDC004354]
MNIQQTLQTEYHSVHALAGGFATLILNRPERRNEFTRTMRREMIEAFDRCDADDPMRAARPASP